MANIGFISLGCAKNQVDCERMMYRVQEAGHTVQPDIVGSDVVVSIPAVLSTLPRRRQLTIF